MLKLTVTKKVSVGDVLAFVDDDGDEVIATVHSLDRNGNAQLEIADADDDDFEDDEDLETAADMDDDDDDDSDDCDPDDEDCDDEDDDSDDDDAPETAAAYHPRRRVLKKHKLTPAEIRKRKLRNRHNRVHNKSYQKRYRAKHLKQIERNAKKRLALHIKPVKRQKGYSYDYA